ncbi:MAG: efflux RND transporter periplasmic adaptor subunit [Gemmatimonadota bacterium]|nr:efflux RND transporter periplasmic adaptor subunit [Gemmatimonadota bacterium]
MTRTDARSPALLPALLLLVGAAAACGQAPASDGVPAESELSIAPENVAVVAFQDLHSGPSISGTLEPTRQASLRAEIGGPILEVRVEAGQRVSAGELLLRLDDTALREGVRSAESAVRVNRDQADLGRRNLERAERLAAAGAIADQSVEQARATRLGADAGLAEAESRLIAARKQLDKTEIRAPFAGIVSVRPANAGDVVQPGTPLATVIDPSSMQLKAAIPLEALDSIRAGLRVDFSVPGYESRLFTGTVARINPSVDPVTRQLPVTITIPNPGGALVAGLFAEGRLSVRSGRLLAVPFAALDLRGAAPVLTVLRAGRTVSLPASLGLRDEALEMVEITAGLVEGDTVLLGSVRGTAAGTLVRVGRDR